MAPNDAHANIAKSSKFATVTAYSLDAASARNVRVPLTGLRLPEKPANAYAIVAENAPR